MKNQTFLFVFRILSRDHLVTYITFFAMDFFNVFVPVAEVCKHSTTELTLVRLFLGVRSQVVIQLKYISKIVLAIARLTKVYSFLLFLIFSFEPGHLKIGTV